MIRINLKFNFYASEGMRSSEIVNVAIGRAACEACSAMWNFGTNSTFDLGPRRTLTELTGRRNFRIQTDF
jgi:hypothetical protein